MTLLTQCKYRVLVGEGFREYMIPPFNMHTSLLERSEAREPSDSEVKAAALYPYRQLARDQVCRITVE